MTDRENDRPTGRRGFFREGLAGLVGPLADLIERRVPGMAPPPQPLRPPGAIQEALFADTCRRCGKCVEICPADAIRPLHRPNRPEHGTPAIDPDRAACVVCDGLQCTHVCPSGALLPVLSARLISMGLAKVSNDLCVRSGGENCTACVDACPLGSNAIWIGGPGPPSVSEDGCVGCGVCQHVCPTKPKAVVVEPL